MKKSKSIPFMAIGADELHRDYQGWCRTRKAGGLGEAAFVAEFDRLREQPELASVRKLAQRYYGIRLTKNRAGRLSMVSDRA